MAKIKNIYDDAEMTLQIYPQTHEKAVVDNNGTTAETKFQMITDLVNQKQMEIGAVPSDLKPTPNSTNWATSGGVYDAVTVISDDNLINMSKMSVDSTATSYMTATKDTENNGVQFTVLSHRTISSFGRIYQMHLIAGKTYRLSFDYLNTAYSTAPSFRDSGNVYIPSSISEVSVNVNTSYETYTCTFVAPEGVYYLAFASLTFGTANSSLTIKNFNCVEITSLKEVVEELDKVYDELQRFGHESLEMKQGTIVSGEITTLSTRIYSNIVNAPCYIRVKNGYSVTGVNWFSAKDYGSTNYIKNDWRTYRREINIFDSGYVAFVITNAGASGNISPSADCIEVFQNGDQYNAVNARMLEALKDYNFSIPQLGCGRKMISRPSDTYVHAPSVNITKKYLFITYHSSMHKTSESFNDNSITLYVRDNEWGWTDYIDIFDDLMIDLKIGNDRITYIYNQNVINTDDNTLFVMAGAHVGSDWAWVYRFFDAPNNVLSAPAIVQLSYGGNTVDFNLSNYIAMLNTLYGKSYTAISSINSNELSGIAKSGSTYYSVFALLVTSSNGIVPHVLMSSPDCITWTPIAMLSDTHKNCETTLTILNNKIYIGFRMVSDGVFYMVTDLEGTILKDWTTVSNVSSRSCMTQAGGKVYYAYNVANGSSKHWSRNAMCIAEVNQSTYELTTIKTYYSNDGYNYFALCPTLNQNLMVVNTEDSRGYNYASGNATTDINIAEIELLTS